MELVTEPIKEKKTQYSQDPDKIKFVTFDQFQSIIKEAKKASSRDFALLNISYYHGLRISEVSKLQISDYDEQSQRIRIRRAKGGLGFTYKLADECQVALKKWLIIRGKEAGPLFPSRRSTMIDGQLGISKRQLDTIFKEYAQAAGIPEELQHFHTLRHGIAVRMVDKDIPLIHIKDWLGHRSIQSTEVYARVSDNARNVTADRLFKKDEQVDKDKEKVPRGTVKRIDWGKDKKNR